MAKPKLSAKAPERPVDFESFVRAAMQTGKPPKAKRSPKKR
jgi:hypothetical protein